MAVKRPRPVDFVVLACDRTVVFRPATPRAKGLVSRIGLRPSQWLGTRAFVVDHRIADDLAQLLEDEGYTFSDRRGR
jgi:hypothetical protein